MEGLLDLGFGFVEIGKRNGKPHAASCLVIIQLYHHNLQHLFIRSCASKALIAFIFTVQGL